MINRNIVITFILLSGLLNSCMMFGGFATKLYFNNKDNGETIASETTFENYKIVAEIPEAVVGKKVKYSINIYDSEINKLIVNNAISLKIKYRYESKVRHPGSHYKYREIANLNTEFNDKKGIAVSTFMYEYYEPGTYQLNFTITSIDGNQLDNPIIVITNLKVL